MAYAIQNALFQWEEGERRLRDAPELERADLESAVYLVLDELRRRLGSAFTVDELASLYGSGVDWAATLARRASAGSDAPWVVDAAFNRYAREAADYAGGKPRDRYDRL
jgi:hypothetical protein